MKNNTLSVKKLMKNLILRPLRQLYAVSEIIILIRWATPPQKVENLQFEFFLSFEILQFFKFFKFAKSSLFPSFFVIGYIYIYAFMSSTAYTYSYFFKLLFLLSECDRTLPLYAILNPIYSQILHVRSIWNSFKVFTVSLSAEEIANETLKQILSRFSVLPLKPFRIPRCIILFTHDLTRSHLHSTWVTHVAWRRKGRGMFVPKSSGEQFLPWL